MKRFWVKVCGVTRPADAELAVELGADMIGMVFYRRSPRFVTVKSAAAVAGGLPSPVARVGVFVNESVQVVLSRAERLKLDYVQLHGSESVAEVAKIRRAGLKVIKAYGIQGTEGWQRLMSSRADLVLADNITRELRGGTGRTFDWSSGPPEPIDNLVLSGGITAVNVARGVARFHPLVVDVNSGVESTPGVKSPRKLRGFMRICNELRYGC